MWIAFTDAGPVYDVPVLINTISGMTIRKHSSDDKCVLTFEEKKQSYENPVKNITIRGEFDSFVLSLQALDLRQ